MTDPIGKGISLVEITMQLQVAVMDLATVRKGYLAESAQAQEKLNQRIVIATEKWAKDTKNLRAEHRIALDLAIAEFFNKLGDFVNQLKAEAEQTKAEHEAKPNYAFPSLGWISFHIQHSNLPVLDRLEKTVRDVDKEFEDRIKPFNKTFREEEDAAVQAYAEEVADSYLALAGKYSLVNKLFQSFETQSRVLITDEEDPHYHQRLYMDKHHSEIEQVLYNKDSEWYKKV